MLRTGFHLPLCQTEGLITSIIRLLGLELSIPDYTNRTNGVVGRYRELFDFAKACAASVAILTSLSLLSPATPTAPTT
jgi:hypothetical protein